MKFLHIILIASLYFFNGNIRSSYSKIMARISDPIKTKECKITRFGFEECDKEVSRFGNYRFKLKYETSCNIKNPSFSYSFGKDGDKLASTDSFKSVITLDKILKTMKSGHSVLTAGTNIIKATMTAKTLKDVDLSASSDKCNFYVRHENATAFLGGVNRNVQSGRSFIVDAHYSVNNDLGKYKTGLEFKWNCTSSNRFCEKDLGTGTQVEVPAEYAVQGDSLNFTVYVRSIPTDWQSDVQYIKVDDNHPYVLNCVSGCKYPNTLSPTKRAWIKPQCQFSCEKYETEDVLSQLVGGVTLSNETKVKYDINKIRYSWHLRLREYAKFTNVFTVGVYIGSPFGKIEVLESSTESSKQNFVKSLDSLEKIEEFSKIPFPTSLKKILEANDFNTCLHFLNINDNIIENIEGFCRNVLPNLIDKKEYKQYFGIYHLKPEEFHLTQGHRMIITMIAKELKEKYRSFDEDISDSKKPLKLLPSVNSSESQSESVESCDEKDDNSVTISQAINTWVKSKTQKNFLEDISKSLHSLEFKIERRAQGKVVCGIKCFCGSTVVIQKLRKNNSERWIYSNFHKHFLKFHNRNTENETVTNRGKYQQLLLTHFAKPMNNCKQKEVEVKQKIHILQDLIISPASDASREDHRNEVNSVIKIDTSMETDKTTALGNHIIDNKTVQCENSKFEIEFPRETSEEEFNHGTKNHDERLIHLEEKFFENFVPNEDNSLKRKIRELHPDQATIVSSTMLQKQGNTDSLKKFYDEKKVIKLEQSQEKLKWKTQYSRLERKKRLRKKNISTTQSKITEYYVAVQKLENFLENNTDLKNKLEENFNFNSVHSEVHNGSSKLLDFILNIAEKNLKRNKFAHRYDDVMKQFCLYLYYVGGKLLYETLQANLPDALPSITTLNNFIEENSEHYEEGYFDFSGLSEYLTQRNLPRLIWLAEDATRISGKIEYDPKTDRIVGFSPPLECGLPNAGIYQASSEKRIREIFETAKKANYINVCMAQPLSPEAPAYILSVFGTDHKFTFRDVSARWRYIQENLTKHNISLIGISTDGDSRFLKSMKVSSLLGNVSRFTYSISTAETLDWNWYHMTFDETVPCFIQDEVHIGTKLRTRLIKPNIILPIGDYFISIDHIKELVDNIPKNEHFLSKGDLKPIDKMNFEAADKICSNRVIHLLETKVMNTKGTIIFLRHMRGILDAFLSKDIDIKERLHKLWCGVFFFRIWKLWLKDQKKYCMKDNFISASCYDAIELNAHNFIKLLRLFRIKNVDNTSFCPWMFSSQSCEKLFRAARSMTSTFSTVINFSLKDFLNRISRLRVLNNITFDLQDDVKFPRELKKYQEKYSFSLCDYIEDYEIKHIVEKALEDTISSMVDVGVVVDHHKITELHLKTTFSNEIETAQPNFQYDVNEENEDDDLNNNEEEMMDIEGCTIKDDENSSISPLLENEIMLQQSLATNARELASETSKNKNIYINLKTENGFELMKKSTFIWLLDENDGKPSNDRLKRFILPKKTENKSKKKFKKTKTSLNLPHNSSGDSDDCSFLKEPGDSDSTSEEQADDYMDNSYSYKNRYLDSDNKIEIEKFYAVYYNDPIKQWFIGQIKKQIKDDIFQISFLKDNGGEFIFSRVLDITNVKRQFIFYGPLALQSNKNQHYLLKRADFVKIKQIFKNI